MPAGPFTHPAPAPRYRGGITSWLSLWTDQLLAQALIFFEKATGRTSLVPPQLDDPLPQRVVFPFEIGAQLEQVSH